MRFKYLADHPALVPVLAKLHFQQWGYLRPQETLESRTLRLRSYCGYAAIPTVVIALDVEELCGSAMLIPHEVDDSPDLTPWLDGVFVAPAFRRQGVASALVQRIVVEAESLGIGALYLFLMPGSRHSRTAEKGQTQSSNRLAPQINILSTSSRLI